MITNQCCLFAMHATRQFGERLCRHLGMALSAHEERGFEDGEHKIRPLVNVRERDVFVVQSLHSDHDESVNDKLCRLLFFIGALRDASAARVTAVIPYLCYQRKERKTRPRDPVTTRYLATLFEAVGTDRILAMDVHNIAAYQNAFRCRTDHLEARGLFADHVAAALGDEGLVVVSPDAGGMKRAEQFRKSLGQRLDREVGMAFMEKHRSRGVVSGEAVVGALEGKVAIVVDDLISTGTTLLRTAEACRSRGASKVLAVVTHGVFSAKANEVLGRPALDRVLVTDTVPPFRLDHDIIEDKLQVLSAAPLFAEAIRSIHEGGSIGELLDSPS